MKKVLRLLFFTFLGVSFFAQTMEKPGKREKPESEEIEPIVREEKRAKVGPEVESEARSEIAPEIEELPAAESLEADEAFKELVQELGNFLEKPESAAIKAVEIKAPSRIPGIPLPSDLWKIIVQYVATGQTLDEVIANLRALNATNKYFYALLHDKQLVSILFKQILDNFKGLTFEDEITNIQKIAKINYAFYDSINDYQVMSHLISQLFERADKEFKENTYEERWSAIDIADRLRMVGSQDWAWAYEKLINAIENHDTKAIDEYIDKKLDLNLALYEAIDALDLDILKLFIHQMKEENIKFHALLLYLISNLDLAEKIMKAHGEQKKNLKTKFLNILHYLIQHQKDLKDDKLGILSWAIYIFESPDIIELLLKGGADPDSPVPPDLAMRLMDFPLIELSGFTALALAKALKQNEGFDKDLLDRTIDLLKRYGASEALATELESVSESSD